MKPKININTATREELKSLPNIDEVAAAKIITHRIENGPITSSRILKEVTGFNDDFITPLIPNLNVGIATVPELDIFVWKPTDSYAFTLNLEGGADNFGNYKLELQYVYQLSGRGGLFRPVSKKGTFKKTIAPGSSEATSGEMEISINLYDGTFYPNQNFQILLTSPKGTEVFNSKLQVSKEEELSIAIHALGEDLSYHVTVDVPEVEEDETTPSYKDFMLLTETKIKRGTSISTEKQSFKLLPDFEVDVTFADVDSIESVSFKITTPKGEELNSEINADGDVTSWKNLPYDGAEPNFVLRLPSLNQLSPTVYLDERLEESLDIWADHDLLLSYDILDGQTLEFKARVEEEYSIRTDLDDDDKRGFAKVNLNYFGVVEAIDLQVRSPRGEIIGKSKKTPQEIIENDSIVEIEVPPRRIAELLNLQLLPERPKKTVGRVLDFYGRKKFEGVQVLLYATVDKEEEGEERAYYPILTTKTETDGYFIINAPQEFYEDAYAIIGLLDQEAEEVRVPIRLEPDQVITKVQDGDEVDENGIPVIMEEVSEKLFFPAQILLVFNPNLDSSPGHDDTCDCGTCKELDFHKQRKVLEEFSYYSIVRTTEPQIKGYTLQEDGKMRIGDFVDLIEDYDLREDDLPSGFLDQEIERNLLEKYINTRRGITVNGLQKAMVESRALKLRERVRPTRINRAQGRKILDATNPIDWDEDPTIYQATSLAHGHVLHFKQEWVNDGYSLGDLIYSLPLAPGQKKQIVTFDWERREAAVGIESLDYQESLQNTLSRDRDINEIVQGAVGEQSQGGSTASTSSSSVAGGGSGGFGLNLGFISIGGGGGASTSSGSSRSSSNAWQNSSRSSTMSSLQQLRDRTQQSASATRSQRSTVIQTASQGERFSIETETIANYNHCHALTIQYFEVLRHFKLQHRLSDVRECLFIPLEMTTFDGKKALRWREVLSRYLIRDPFSRRLETRRFLFGSGNPLSMGFDAIERIENNYEGSNLPLGIYADERLDYLEGSLYLKFQLTRPKDGTDEETGESIFQAVSWSFLGLILPATTALALFQKYKNLEEIRKDEAFQTEVAPDIAEAFVQHLKIEAILENGSGVDLNIDATLVSRFANNRNLQVTLRMGGTSLGSLRRSDIRFIRIGTSILGDSGDYLDPSELLPENS